MPVLSGTWHEMGQQYGALMASHMQKTWDVLVAASVENGAIGYDEMSAWAHRALRAFLWCAA